MTLKRRTKWTNARGQCAHRDTEPPDVERCQARPNMLQWSFMSFGPKPKPERCENKALFVAVENAPRDDDKIGSMSLCGDCLALLRKHTKHSFAKVYPITPEDRNERRPRSA